MSKVNAEGTTDHRYSWLNFLPFTRLPGSVLSENKQIFEEQSYHVRNEKIDLSELIKTMQQGTLMFGHDEEEKAHEELRNYFENNHTEHSENQENSHRSELKVLDADCLRVAFELEEKTHRKPLVLNLANRHGEHVCGKYWHPYLGSQEEFIERKSAVYRYSLDPQHNEILKQQLVGRVRNPNNITHHIPRFGAIVSPGVPIIRKFEESNDYALSENVKTIDVVACGAVDLRRKWFRETDVLDYYDSSNNFNEEKFIKDTKLKIRIVLLAALKTGHKDLVLGALGCGAFLNDPAIVSKCFHEVLKEPHFHNKFENIYFAILGKKNSSIFQKELEDLIH
ncbi:hypothetical protein C9374_003491 [Naegleria lovaniensis]|uniref:Microbial-type PARG catalytic domain-containing protein n=1 Tax=Naegleria lovaniensis TaxID=51637 RepID=A0AA88KLT4_NAELO|nr:uncharacterized protein C9374_003491 [Naegleria lovaniensis]KAG2385676.1 hypothetical protein C9374_003491 [Naegleria lovaniensis]